MRIFPPRMWLNRRGSRALASDPQVLEITGTSRVPREAVQLARIRAMAKTPAYRLQVLFEMREKTKKEKEEIYAEKRKKVAEEQKKLDDMRQTLKQMVQLRHDKKAEYAERTRRGEYTVSQIQANDRHIERLKQQEAAYQVEIDRQQERVQEAER